ATCTDAPLYWVSGLVVATTAVVCGWLWPEPPPDPPEPDPPDPPLPALPLEVLGDVVLTLSTWPEGTDPSGSVTSTRCPGRTAYSSPTVRVTATTGVVDVTPSTCEPGEVAAPAPASCCDTRTGPGRNTTWPRVSSRVTVQPSAVCHRSTAASVAQPYVPSTVMARYGS